jgi:hypothetical protein
MDIVLIILGVLGFGAIVIAAYVFTVAARNYVSDEDHPQRATPVTPGAHNFIPRSPTDRRRNEPAVFPLTVNGVVIAQDRRHLPERRAAA